jgi:hypothetical protein
MTRVCYSSSLKKRGKNAEDSLPVSSKMSLYHDLNSDQNHPYDAHCGGGGDLTDVNDTDEEYCLKGQQWLYHPGEGSYLLTQESACKVEASKY